MSPEGCPEGIPRNHGGSEKVRRRPEETWWILRNPEMSGGILGNPEEIEDIPNNPEEPNGIRRTPWGYPEESFGILEIPVGS
eukprot:3018807-Pyramimonas_sp.AAC.1